jgi:hydrogenase 3 maturation protease
MKSLAQALRGRLVVAGVGCRARGDDGVGPELAGRLAELGTLRAIDCGDSPEDFTGEIAAERPDTVLIVDAVEMGAEPGDVAIIKAADLPRGSAADTHRASLRAVMEYLEARTGAAVMLIGVQPAVVSDGEQITAPVMSTLERLEAVLRNAGVGERADGPVDA